MSDWIHPSTEDRQKSVVCLHRRKNGEGGGGERGPYPLYAGLTLETRMVSFMIAMEQSRITQQ